MPDHLTNQSRKVLALANDAARSFNHTYVGTEHILLALIEENSTELTHVLATLNINADKIRAEVERLVTRGNEPTKLRTLPLTPLAAQTIEYARQEALLMNEKCVGPEHLFLGLVRDQSGIACQVLLNVGVRSTELRNEVFKIRLAQMKLVEQAVRPVRVSTPRKRKMREELLAHLIAVYDQEFARLQDPSLAMEAAASRFGEPAELGRELQSALPTHERLSYFVEKFVQYRAPESAARYSFRMAIHTFAALAVILGIVTFGVFLRYGWTPEVKTLTRIMTYIALATPPAQFVVWLAYIKMRDAMWGVFGSRKSLTRVFVLAAVITIMGAIYLIGVTAAAHLDFGVIRELPTACGWMPLVSAIALIALARTSGPYEIRDTLWAFVDVEA